MTHDALERARAKLAELKAAGAIENIDPTERARRHPESLDLAIRAMCYECMGRDEPGAQQDIAECDHWDCPLWQFRPHQQRVAADYGISERRAALADALSSRLRYDPLRNAARDQKSRRKAITAKCAQCMGGPSRDEPWRRLIRDCPSRFPGDTTCACPLWPHRPYRVDVESSVD